MNIFENLTIARQIQFKEGDGEIRLLGERVFMVSSSAFISYVKTIMDDDDAISKLYHAIKQSMRDDFSVSIGKKFGFDFKSYTKWFVDLAVFAGWGKIEFEEIDEKEKSVVMTIRNSPEASYMKGSAKRPCDHLIRALFAGGASAAFKEDVDAVEVECAAMGAQKCRFIIGKKDYLKKSFPEAYKAQVGT